MKDYWLRYHAWFKEFDKIIMGIDPATWLKEVNDFTGVVVIGLIGNNTYEIFSTWLKLSPNKLLQTVYNIFLKYKPDVVIKEANKETKLAEDLIIKGVPLLDVWTSKDKFVRAEALASLVEAWFCYFLERQESERWIDEDKDLVYQMVNFPEVKHEDVFDAWMMCQENAQTDFLIEGAEDEVVII